MHILLILRYLIAPFISRTRADRLYLLLVDRDIKKATTRLRTVATSQTDHASIFRVGLYLGLAIAAVVDGLYNGQRL